VEIGVSMLRLKRGGLGTRELPEFKNVPFVEGGFSSFAKYKLRLGIRETGP